MNNELNDFKEIPTPFLSEIEMSEKDFFESTIESNNEPEKIETPISSKSEMFNFETGAENEAQFKSSENAINIGEIIDAKIATNIYDIVATTLIGMGVKAVSDIEVNKKEISLSQTEQKTLHPVVEKCLQTIKFNFKNPWELLAFVTLVIYGTKLAPMTSEIGNGIYSKFTGKKAKKTASKKSAEKETEEVEPSKYMVNKYGYEEAKKIANNK